MSRVLITGAGGRMGTVLRRGLRDRGWVVRGLDVVPVADDQSDGEQIVADVTDLAAMTDAMRDVDAVVHLAGFVGEADWPALSQANVDGTYCTLEAARRAGVRRVVLASSNHATGFTPRPATGLLAEADAPPRPDTFYGVAKVAMEALGSLYADRYGMDVVCLRIGSAAPEPSTLRMLSTWLSPADSVSLVDVALTTPAPGFAIVWGVSANTRNWWDLTAARDLGYEPVDNAEIYAEALIKAHGEPDVSDPVHIFVGGEYARREFDADGLAAD